MATLEQLINGLRKADAAGNADDAKLFADAIRQMQAEPPRETTTAEGLARGIAPYVGRLSPLAKVLRVQRSR